jgi:hypothetical protein
VPIDQQQQARHGVQFFLIVFICRFALVGLGRKRGSVAGVERKRFLRIDIPVVFVVVTRAILSCCHDQLTSIQNADIAIMPSIHLCCARRCRRGGDAFGQLCLPNVSAATMDDHRDALTFPARTEQ